MKNVMRRYIRIYDDWGNLLAWFFEDCPCDPQPPCGGCINCIEQQALYYGRIVVEGEAP